MSEQPHGPTQHHQPDKTGNPTQAKGLLSGNNKWYLVGGLVLVGVLVIFFVRKSNSNAASSSTPTSATLDPTTEAMLQSALQGLQASNANGYNQNSYGGGGTTGAVSTGGGATTVNTPVTLSMPDGRLGWENVTFPSVQAVGEWTAWNAGQTVPGTRSAWNQELQSLGATGWLPVVPYNPNAPLGSPGNTGNPLDTE